MLEPDGFEVLPDVYDETRLTAIEAGLAAARSRGGLKSHGGRNLIPAWPGLSNVVRGTAVETFLRAMSGCGLVRALLFDKPPGRCWFVAWHKDLSIAVSGSAERATVKAGVPHVEAPEDLLRRMVAVRIHLDDANEENGCLEVVPGSHLEGKRVVSTDGARALRARRGDVLLMRPLLTHRSRRSRPEATSGRRVIHLEWAPAGPPSPGLEWHDFEPL